MTSNNIRPIDETDLYNISLKAVLPTASFLYADDVVIHDAVIDSRKPVSGKLFVCIPGLKVDGHDFAALAVANGACGLLVERFIPTLKIPQCRVENSRLAYGKICQAIFGNPASELKIVGVTGTNGKTTCAYLIQQLLEFSGEKCGCLGTVFYSDGETRSASSMTTPDAYELAYWIQQMVRKNTRFLAMEVSSHALKQDRLSGVKLSQGVITNITHDHLDYHHDFEDYLKTKGSIQKLLADPQALLINRDDAGIQQLLDDQILELPVKMLGTAGDSYRLLNYRTELTGIHFEIEVQEHKYEFSSKLTGRHNIWNLLCALAVMHEWGFSLNELQKHTPRLLPAPGRMESVKLGQKFEVFIDYAHTPDAIENILQTLRPLTRQRLICVFGAGGDRDKSKRPFMGRAGCLADILIITSDNPRSEEPEKIMQEIYSGCLQVNSQTHIFLIIDRAEAIRQACEIAQLGDIVVIAGKGHESTQTIGDNVLKFDDKTVVTEVLTSQGKTHLNYPELRIPA